MIKCTSNNFLNWDVLFSREDSKYFIKKNYFKTEKLLFSQRSNYSSGQKYGNFFINTFFYHIQVKLLSLKRENERVLTNQSLLVNILFWHIDLDLYYNLIIQFRARIVKKLKYSSGQKYGNFLTNTQNWIVHVKKIYNNNLFLETIHLQNQRKNLVFGRASVLFLTWQNSWLHRLTEFLT